MSLSREGFRNIVGIIGNIISFGLFLSPTPTFYRIFKKKDVEEFQAYPYIATVLNCMFWILYGMPFVKPDSLLVVTINGIGLVIEIIYLSIFWIYDNKQNQGRKKIAYGILGELALFCLVAIPTLLCAHTHAKRTYVVGAVCVFFNILMYASPLLVMKKVIQTKSVEYMPFFLSLAGCLNGGCWTAYALIKFDPFLLTSNGFGFAGGIAQLILYACYYKSTPKNKDNEVATKQSEIQLPRRECDGSAA